MRDRLSTVESLLNEHEAIRGHMKQVRDSVKNLESILGREEALGSRSAYLTAVTAKQQDLKQTWGYLEDGLRIHHAHEENVMPPLVGELIWQGIKSEHDEQIRQFKKINPALQDSDVQQFLDQLSYIKKTVEDICQAASLHSIREDGILYFLKEAPESSGTLKR